MKSHLREHGVDEASTAEARQSIELGRAHGLPLEDLALQMVVVTQIFNDILSGHLLLELLTGFVEPLQVLTLNLKRKGLVLSS